MTRSLRDAGLASQQRQRTRTYLVDSRSLGHGDCDYKIVKVEIHRALILDIDKRVSATGTWPAVDGQRKGGFILRLQSAAHAFRQFGHRS